ncbi:MAG: PHP domain-containing protein [Lentisphaeria bacterium]|nr:PHP domain-containing protein [Lentisphaeria bacterium]
MNSIEVLVDMVGRHVAHDVYDLWIETRSGSPLFGWDRSDGGQCTFCLLPDGKAQPVGRPWSPGALGESYRATPRGTRPLRAQHALQDVPGASSFGVVCTLDDSETHEFWDEDASLLFPAVCIAADDTPWVAWIRCVDVENDDGVVDQANEIECARLQDGKWVRESIADLRYGLLPKTGVWGYPGRRRRPYLVPDERGGVWVMWERKEPHDGSTTQVPGVLCARRWIDGSWQTPVRLVERGFFDYVPTRQGVRGGTLIVAAQKSGLHDCGSGRGEVVVLEVGVEDAPALRPDTGFEQWRAVNLLHRPFFDPADREITHDGESYRLLFGDPHTHTCLSADAEGDLVEMLAYARDKAKLDFVAFTDNDYIYGGRLSDQAWHETMAAEQAWSENDTFIAVPAYEWTQARWGAVIPQHRSILFHSYDQPILRWSDVVGDPIDALSAWIQTTDGVMNTQHANFLLTKSNREANMEVICGWGDYINKSKCFHEHLNRGFRGGFVGTSDGHRRTPGLGGGMTGLWVKEFTLAGIIEAFRQRRCYATAGARIGLGFWVNDAFMGETLTGQGTFAARVAVQAPRDIERLEIFGDGEVVASLTDLPCTFDERIDDLPPCSWYYAKVTMPGGFPEYPTNIAPAEGPWAWSSPVFVKS